MATPDIVKQPVSFHKSLSSGAEQPPVNTELQASARMKDTDTFLFLL